MPDLTDFSIFLWLAAGVGMVVHIIGVLALGWSWDGASWWVVLFLLVAMLGVNAIDG